MLWRQLPIDLPLVVLVVLWLLLLLLLLQLVQQARRDILPVDAAAQAPVLHKRPLPLAAPILVQRGCCSCSGGCHQLLLCGPRASQLRHAAALLGRHHAML
jgi:hypothetical protein